MAFFERVWNKLHIVGSPEEINRLLAQASGYSRKNKPFSFDRFICQPPFSVRPMKETPEEEEAEKIFEEWKRLYGYRNADAWRKARWGCIRDCEDVEICFNDVDDIEIEFDTFDKPPHKVVAAMALCYPGLTIYHDWIHYGNSERGFKAYRFGRPTKEKPTFPDSNG